MLYSTVSSALSGSAANFWEDVLKGIFTDLTESRKAVVNRVLGNANCIYTNCKNYLQSCLPRRLCYSYVIVHNRKDRPIRSHKRIRDIKKIICVHKDR